MALKPRYGYALNLDIRIRYLGKLEGFWPEAENGPTLAEVELRIFLRIPTAIPTYASEIQASLHKHEYV